MIILENDPMLFRCRICERPTICTTYVKTSHYDHLQDNLSQTHSNEVVYEKFDSRRFLLFACSST